jgi:hypothetical protein
VGIQDFCQAEVYLSRESGVLYLTIRWIGRELLEVISTEFRDRSVEYYVSRQSRSEIELIQETRTRVWSD